MSDYWDRYGTRRVTRRAVIRGAMLGGLGIGAAALLGCQQQEDTPSRATSPTGVSPTSSPDIGGVAPAEACTPGGTLRIFQASDPDNFDPQKNVAIGGATTLPAYANERLFRYKTGIGGLSDGTIEGAILESWELPDPQLIIGKIRSNAQFDSREPTNGRRVTAEDVVVSWETHAEFQPRRTDLSNKANPAAPVLDIKAVDDSTIHIRLARPDATIFDRFTQSLGALYVLPIEARNGGYDTKLDMRGSGPWMLTEHRSQVSFTFAKNPNHWDSGRPLLDGISLAVIPDRTQQEAQFKAGAIHIGGVPISNMLAVFREMQGTAQIALGAPSLGPYVYGFGWRPGSPFYEVRIRRALSLLLDRDALIDSILEPDSFRQAGVDMGVYWPTPLTKPHPMWLDPQSPEFGPDAQIYVYNPKEARQLLEAADAVGLEFELHIPAGPGAFGQPFTQWAEAVSAMWSAGGVKARLDPADNATVYQKNYFRTQGDYDGMVADAGSGRGIAETSLGFHFDPLGVNSMVGGGKFGGDLGVFPELTNKLLKVATLLDPQERRESWNDIQRHIARDVPAIFPPSGATETPFLVNSGVCGGVSTFPFQNQAGVYSQELYPYLGLDDSLRKS